MESRKPRFKQLAFPKEIGCCLAGGDWPTYKEMIMVFAHRNRDIKVDIVENYHIDDSESDTANPSQGPGQDRTPDPDDKDEQDHDEEHDPEDEVEEEEEEEEEEEDDERSRNGQNEEPHDLPHLEGCSTESDSSSVEEETGSEWGHEDSTNSECSDDKLKSIPKRKSEHKTVEVPINAHLGKDHTVRMA